MYRIRRGDHEPKEALSGWGSDDSVNSKCKYVNITRRDPIEGGSDVSVHKLDQAPTKDGSEVNINNRIDIDKATGGGVEIEMKNIKDREVTGGLGGVSPELEDR